MNFIRLLCGLGADAFNDVSDGIEAWVERYERTMAQAKWMVGLPIGLFVLAMLIGGVGQREATDVAALYLMDAATIIAAVLFIAALLNGSVLGTFFALATLVANKISGDKIPKVEVGQVWGMARKVTAAAALLFMVCLAGMYFPLWRSVHQTAIVIVTAFIIAMMVAGWGYKSQMFKKLATGLVACLLIHGLTQFNPSLKRFNQAASNNALAKVDRLSGQLEAEAQAITEGKASLPETSAATNRLSPTAPASNANAAPPSVVRSTATSSSAPNANAAPPTLTGGATVNAQEAAGAEKPQPRIPGELADKYDELYGDLL